MSGFYIAQSIEIDIFKFSWIHLFVCVSFCLFLNCIGFFIILLAQWKGLRMKTFHSFFQSFGFIKSKCIWSLASINSPNVLWRGKMHLCLCSNIKQGKKSDKHPIRLYNYCLSLLQCLQLCIYLLYFFLQPFSGVNKIIYTYTWRGNRLKLQTFPFKFNEE